MKTKYRLKYRLIRLFLKLWTIRIKVSDRGKASIKPQEQEEYYPYFQHGAIPESILKSLALAFQTVFSLPPWNEKLWKEALVRKKVYTEIGTESNPVLTVKMGDSKFPICGFSWGAIIKTTSVASRVIRGLLLSSDIEYEQDIRSQAQELEKILTEKGEQILFYDEFAILPGYRSGVDPIRFMFRPGFEMAFEQGVRRVIFWSTPESKIVPLAIFMGFQPILKLDIGEKRIVFLYSKDFVSLLKAAQSIESRKVKRVMSFLSKLS